MKMYSTTRKFDKFVYSLVILWCYVMRVNGDSDTYIETLVMDNDTYIESVVIDNDTYVEKLVMSNDTYVEPLIMDNDTYVETLVMDNDTYIEPLVIDNDTYVESLVTDNDTYVESSMVAKNSSNSDLFNTLSGEKSVEKKLNSLNSMIAMDINAGSVNFNIPFTFPDSNSNSNDAQSEKPITNVRGDYTLAEGIGYYKLHTRTVNWNTARKACMDEKAHLVVVNSVKEANVLNDLMRGRDIDTLYIGTHDIFEEGEWITLFGESLEKAGYDVWASGEPNNENGNEDCGVIRRGGEMNDIPCNLERHFVCEISL